MKNKKSIIELCRELRRNQTTAESILWEALRNRKLNGVKFNRQYPLIYASFNNKKSFFIADFYCAEASLVIEVDGSIHEYQQEYDYERDKIIEAKQLKVVRFSNFEIENNLHQVLNKIKDNIN